MTLGAVPAFATEGFYTQIEQDDGRFTQTQFVTQSECIANCSTVDDWAIVQNGTVYHFIIENHPSDTTNWGGNNSFGAMTMFSRMITEGGVHGCLGTTNGGCELGAFDFASTDPDNTNGDQLWFDPNTLNGSGNSFYLNFTGDGSYKIEPFWTGQNFTFIWSYYPELQGGIVTDENGKQLVVNGVSSIQNTLFFIAGTVWPWALAVVLFFLAIRFGMLLFKQQ